jgi:imidazolonepropionase-like amidohydrolase
MKLLILFLFFLVSNVFVANCQNHAYVIRNVSIIAMNDDNVHHNKNIYIKNGKIEKIVDYSEAAIEKAYKVIDGGGKYILPGLFDMHTHFMYEQGLPIEHATTELGLMLANGVTTIRIMNGGNVYRDFIKKNLKGHQNFASPSIVLVSPQLVGEWPWKNDTVTPKQIVNSPELAAAAVRKFKQEGYHAIKIAQFIKQDVYNAIISEAKKQRIPVTGHVGPWVKLPAALKAGQQVEHLDEFIELLLPDSLLKKGAVSVSDMHIWKKENWNSVDHLDVNKIPLLIKLVKESGIYVTPTNYFFHSNFAAQPTEPEMKQKPDYAFIPDQLLEERANTLKAWAARNIDAGRRAKWIGLRNKIIFELNKAGVPLMCGSDAPAWFMMGGFAVHDELENLVSCGLTPYESLKTATVNPAKYLGEWDKKGSIEKGKVADLLLVDENPFEDIKNTRKISGVFIDGRYYGKQAIESLLIKGKRQ